jgi:hypothetical protein
MKKIILCLSLSLFSLVTVKAQFQTILGQLRVNVDSKNTVLLQNDFIDQESSIRFRSTNLNGSYFQADIALYSDDDNSGFLGFKVPYGNSYGQGYSMIINSSGRVGIGTIDPQSLLSVNGTITSKEVNVTLDGWSDFVFDDDYQLKNLEEVESFIAKNNRLPDIPSENEVLDNGINLGEMDAKLLQKIEELTLYMIDINKEVESLKQENKNLKKEIDLIKQKS